jgi:hypothetical protein
MALHKFVDFRTSKILGILIGGVLIILTERGSVSPAEKTMVPKFENIDELIGWLKAKGTCENIGIDPQQQRCTLRVELSEEKRFNVAWQRWAVMETYPTLEQRLHVAIVRSRNFSLLASDRKADVRSVRTADYWFEKNGKLSEVSVGFFLENFKGERIVNEEFSFAATTPPIFKNDNTAMNIVLLRELGINWDYWR